MATRHAPTSPRHGSSTVERVAAKVTDALRDDQAFAAPSVAFPAEVVGEVAAAIAGLPPETWRRLGSRRADLGRQIRQLMERVGREYGGPIALDIPAIAEASRGEGLGPLVSVEEGRSALDDLAVPRRLEDWAGPVAGASELARDFGIARSTLHRWQQAGEVVALLKGTRKHVFPIAQFIDGRPVGGISDVIRLAGNHRAAWIWLSRPNPVLGGRKPVELLIADRRTEVLDAARATFSLQ
ncbi:antitoxin Xre/MbcA/ParS toxin-binding domain-containing protein [Aurantimonas sp. 22II-16-19i]|uniref:antitoxin Xre/MbcA/ParS-like domain-containing protein n=1 Tax=Aurantimonas sp. 22II-16-19i TaxID=1317114 RepID=UPI0009F7E340|nr:antitoxin Xre/MbcA/ParS toxin-binding domain-containing protein [Aurantimonas sp. 22II-16-19i]ORE87546.1 hypothetical protein ATO4_25510 [Aurantimonas sp. 22II-16-19i]